MFKNFSKISGLLGKSEGVTLVYVYYLQETMLFIEDLLQVVPNSEYKNRKGIDLKKIIPDAVQRGFTAIVVVNEDQKKASIFSKSCIYKT